MTPESMRKIDFYIGVPACFFLGCLGKIAGFFTKNHKPPANPRKIAFIKLSEIGAIVLSYPLLKKIKNAYPEAELYFITFKKNKGIFDVLGGIIPDKNILTIREDSLITFTGDFIRLIKRMNEEKFDLVFDLEFFSRFTAIIAFFSRARIKAGFFRYRFEGLYRSGIFTHKLLYNPLLHIAKSYLSFYQALGKGEKNTPELIRPIEQEELALLKFSFSENEAENLKLRISQISKSKKIILLNPGEGVLPLREWGLENFLSLTRKILEDRENLVILVGLESKKAAELYAKIANERCINLVNKTSISEFLILCSMADALIVNDCGLTHLASLTQIKKFIIFGPESPQVFAPLGGNNFLFYANFPCSPCFSALNHRNSDCADNNCLKKITWQEVYNSVRANI